MMMMMVVGEAQSKPRDAKRCQCLLHRRGGRDVRAAIVDRPLQYLQVTATRCLLTSLRIPRAGKERAPELLQYLQVTTLSCTSACAFIPGAALAPEPLQYLQ